MYNQQYSDTELLDELRRVAGLVPDLITNAMFDQLSSASSATVRRPFGGWPAALAAAGLHD